MVHHSTTSRNASTFFIPLSQINRMKERLKVAEAIKREKQRQLDELANSAFSEREELQQEIKKKVEEISTLSSDIKILQKEREQLATDNESLKSNLSQTEILVSQLDNRVKLKDDEIKLQEEEIQEQKDEIKTKEEENKQQKIIFQEAAKHKAQMDGLGLDQDEILIALATEQQKNNVAPYSTELTRISICQFFTLAACCVGLTLFWIHASRLYTEPNIIKMSNDFNDKCKGPRKYSPETAGITAAVMILDFFRTYLMIMVIPTSIIWYSYYTDDNQSKLIDVEKLNSKRFWWENFCFILTACFLSTLSFVFFVLAEYELTVTCAETSSWSTIGFSFALSFISFVSPITYFFHVIFCSSVYKTKSLSDGTFLIGILVVLDAFACCSTKRRLRAIEQ